MNKNKSQINVWQYKYSDTGVYGETADLLIEEMKHYATENSINLGITSFSSEELTYDDYILKRNTAIATGKADIIIDCFYNFYPIRQYGGDYSKLDTYENIFEGFRGGYCIPVGIEMRAVAINNDVLKHYGVESDSVITFKEYYELKEKLKQAGAKFAATEDEKRELVDYYIYKNQLSIIKDNNKYTVDKELLIRTFDEIYGEYIKINDEIVNVEDDIIFEKQTGYIFKNSEQNTPWLKVLNIINHSSELDFGGINHSIENEDGNYDCTMVIEENYGYRQFFPCVMVNKNTKSEKAYKIAGILFGDEVQQKLHDSYYGVVTDTEKIRQTVEVDSNWKCIRKNSKFNQLYDMKEKGYSILRNNDQSSFFETGTFDGLLKYFIIDEVNKKIKESDTYNDSSFEKSAEDFIINLNVKYN